MPLELRPWSMGPRAQ